LPTLESLATCKMSGKIGRIAGKPAINVVFWSQIKEE
jgi:hypothetical protein